MAVDLAIRNLELLASEPVPAPDYAPPLAGRPWRVTTNAFVIGASSVIAPFAGFSDTTWWTPPWRDRWLLSRDMWRAMDSFVTLNNLPEDLLEPQEERLFDPDSLGVD